MSPATTGEIEAAARQFVRKVSGYRAPSARNQAAFDEASDTWAELWSGDDPSPAEITTFSPPLAPVTFATGRLRISLGDIVEGWSEIDAVGSDTPTLRPSVAGTATAVVLIAEPPVETEL